MTTTCSDCDDTGTSVSKQDPTSRCACSCTLGRLRMLCEATPELIPVAQRIIDEAPVNAMSVRGFTCHRDQEMYEKGRSDARAEVQEAIEAAEHATQDDDEDVKMVGWSTRPDGSVRYVTVSTDNMKTFIRCVPEDASENEDEARWRTAEEHLKTAEAAYGSIPTGGFAMALTIRPARVRFDAGERTDDLYDTIMEIAL